ncbi:hypothetical protein GOODEAATRI_023468 [Goodea atripinnis]|uniref:Uncharacterized protein n=1 Tax=Goodea atripinnis TaxID=208336 RepID=A0ABV0ND39_9TELE
MKFDSYSRFLKSSLYLECLRAEEDGHPLPDPYQIPCSPAPSKHSASSDRSTLSTPKKDIRKQRSGKSPNEDTKDENADKKRGIFFSWSRNRSFGKGPKKKDIGDINLDLWGSNGRRESQGSLSSSASLEIPNSVSAAKMEPLVLDQDCMTLCSRDLRMEKRTLFRYKTFSSYLFYFCFNFYLSNFCHLFVLRLDLVPINRSVGLKAKPTKPVTEVLRPVVAKYGLNLSDLVAKIVSCPQWLQCFNVVEAPVH